MDSICITKMCNDKIGPVLKQYAVVILANLVMLHMGLNVTWPSPVLVKLRNENQTILQQPVTEEEASWIASIPPLAGMLMIFITGYIMDGLGRKTGVLLICVPRLVMSILYLFTSHTWMIYLGRCLSGMADVLTVSVIPTYTSEIASKEIRGALGTVTQIVSAVGMMIMLIVGPFISYFTLNLFCMCVVVVVTIPLFFLPESPYFLYSKGRIDDAIKVLTFLRGSEILACEEIKEYSMNQNVKVNKIEIFQSKIVVITLVKVIILGIGMQLIGYNAVSFYLQIIFESTQTSVSPEVSSAVIGCIQLLACFCTILITDRFGRKPILTTSLVGMGVGMVGLGVFFKLMENRQKVTGFLNYLPLISMMLVIYCYNAGMGSLFWMLIAELLDGPTRAIGMSIAVLTATLFSFLVIKYFAAITTAIGAPATYWMLGTNCVITCLFITFFIPETMGKSFFEIQGALDRDGAKEKIKTREL